MTSPVRPRFDHGSTTGSTSEPWTGNFSGSMTGPVLKTLDLSIFEYFPVSHVIDLSAPPSPTAQIFDIDDEITQYDSDDNSSSVSDSDPIDQRVSPAVGNTEIVDFGIAD